MGTYVKTEPIPYLTCGAYMIWRKDGKCEIRKSDSEKQQFIFVAENPTLDDVEKLGFDPSWPSVQKIVLGHALA